MSEERIKTLTEWMEADPNDPFLPYALALELKKHGNVNQAQKILKDLLQRFPDYLAAYYQLGIMFEETGEKEEALKIYRSGLIKARAQKDTKTSGEINEAIQRLEFE
jgi:tetratricopeptide (TPR) repeat protein